MVCLWLSLNKIILKIVLITREFEETSQGNWLLDCETLWNNGGWTKTPLNVIIFLLFLLSVICLWDQKEMSQLPSIKFPHNIHNSWKHEIIIAPIFVCKWTLNFLSIKENEEYLWVKLKTNLMCSIGENTVWVRLYVCKLFLMSSKVLMKREYPPELWTRSLHREVWKD